MAKRAREEYLMERKNAWKDYSEKELSELAKAILTLSQNVKQNVCVLSVLLNLPKKQDMFPLKKRVKRA